MRLEPGRDYVLGVDFGTDSVRAVVVDAADGGFAGSGVSGYSRWARGDYCEPAANRFRQHPLDYVESLEEAVRKALAEAGPEAAARVRGLSVDTTGSTPCFADAAGTPLALLPAFAEEPDAMFVLWKDHMAIAEADRINALARTWGGEDYTRYEGGIYSSEWFWSKVLRIVEANPRVAAAAATVIEHCDWIPALLTGARDLASLKRSRCAAGHKAMWHASWGGYPPAAFLGRLHPGLPAIAASLGTETYTADRVFGGLSAEWATRLGLPPGLAVSVGAFDAHIGAVGGDVAPGTFLKIMGTSTCDIMVAPRAAGSERLVRGICGQVDGSVVAGFVGYEAGQSAFGDIFAWFGRLMAWPLRALPSIVPKGNDKGMGKIARRAQEDSILPLLEAEAARIQPGASGLLALDWLNGRRTPDADQALSGALLGLTLGTEAPAIYRALVEAAAFGSRAIIERMRSEGIAIERVAAIGGVARKSPLVMQVSADVLGMEIWVSSSDQCVALGAAMFAATAAGLYPDVLSAQAAMRAPVERVYTPDPRVKAVYDGLYARYLELGAFVDKSARSKG